MWPNFLSCGWFWKTCSGSSKSGNYVKVTETIFRSQNQVVSDHNPLTFLTKGLSHGTKLARWALALLR
ncbi:hypothetical protein TNCV_3980941 [Trichonephila clavipes]|nr:hypothetical protein TNCV_3980941 [Trichonephila clavipes]